jgi:SAM-dependent methyltransferase
MLDVARSRVEPELLSNVEFVNGDFITARLAPCSYDLILCLGLLAHVESPSAVVGRVISLLKPGGIVVLENAEWNHPITMLGKLYGKVREMLMPSPGAPQNLTPVRSADVLEMFDRSQFRLEGRYHYSLPLPGMTRLFGEQTLYTLSRLIYGAYPDHRNAQFGNECLYHLRSLRSPQQVLESKSSVCLNLSSAGS